MVITNNSPITTTDSTIYINNVDYDPRVFFTDTGSTFYYILLRDNIVVSTGILSGHYNGSTYDYRFNFNNYIKIDNQMSPIFENFDQVGSIKFSGNNSSILTLCIDTTDLLAANILAGNLTSAMNGIISVSSGHTTSQIVCDNIFEYKFWDKTEESLIMFESNPVIDFEKYFVITMYGGRLYYNYYENSNSVIVASPMMTKTNGYDYTVYMLRIPEGTAWLGLQGYDNNNHQIIGKSIQSQCYGYNNYYFWNPNGSFDSIHCKGNDNVIDTISKNSVQVGNRKVYTDITIQKQITQNTGFGLTQNQVYSLIESPTVIKIIEAEDQILNNTLIDDISNWSVTGDWVYSNYIWSANNSNYSYLMSPVIATADHGFTYTIRFDASIAQINKYKIEVQDFDAVETIYSSFLGYGSNTFTFTCDPSVEHFKIFFFGIDASSGIGEVWNFTMDTGTIIKEDGSKNPYENINLLSGSSINVSGTTYGMGNIPITLMAGQTYTMSANGYVSEASYNAGEWMQVLIYRQSGGWASSVTIDSGIPTTKSVTFTAPTTEVYNVAAYPSVTGATGNVYLTNVKIELGSVATPYTASIDEYLPVSKEYNIDNTVFEGFNGKKLSQKNIELTFTDPKIYKRKTNNTVTFFD